MGIEIDIRKMEGFVVPIDPQCKRDRLLRARAAEMFARRLSYRFVTKEPDAPAEAVRNWQPSDHYAVAHPKVPTRPTTLPRSMSTQVPHLYD